MRLLAHPPTVHLPIGLLVGGWLASVADLVWPSDRWRDVVTFGLAAGMAAALPAVTTGVAELVRLGDALAGHRCERLVMVHLSAMLVGLCGFGAALWVHLAGSGNSGSLTAALTTAATVVMAGGGHVGGMLVYGHGIGTDAEAGSA